MTSFEIAVLLLMFLFSITNLKPDMPSNWYAWLVYLIACAAIVFTSISAFPILRGVN